MRYEGSYITTELYASVQSMECCFLRHGCGHDRSYMGRFPNQLYTQCLAVQTQSDADEVLRLVEQGRSLVCWYGLLPVLRSGHLGSSWWQGSLLQDQSMQQRMQQQAQSRHHVLKQQIRAMSCRNTDS